MAEKLFFVNRPSMKGTSIPMFYYTFAETPDDAIRRVRLKWGEYDADIKCREVTDKEKKELIIATDYYG